VNLSQAYSEFLSGVGAVDDEDRDLGGLWHSISLVGRRKGSAMTSIFNPQVIQVASSDTW